jgi:hypothetical protein
VKIVTFKIVAIAYLECRKTTQVGLLRRISHSGKVQGRPFH